MSFSEWEIYVSSNVAKVKDVLGVYELSKSRYELSEITYIGHGQILTELKKNLNKPGTREAAYFRYEQTSSDKQAKEREKTLLQEFKDKFGHLPKFNERIG